MLYKNGEDTNKYEEYSNYIDIDDYIDEDGKYIYLNAILDLEEAERLDDKDKTNEVLKMLEKSINLGFYAAIKDLINYYNKKEKSQENLLNLYKYKEKLVYYNIK